MPKQKYERTTINLPSDLVKQLKHFFPNKTKTDVIRETLEEAVNMSKHIAHFKKNLGKVNIVSYE